MLIKESSILFTSTTKKILKALYKNSLTIWTISGTNIWNWSILQSIWNHGRIKTARILWKLIEIQDNWMIEKFSRKQSRFLNGNFLITRYKKFQTKGKVLGNL